MSSLFVILFFLTAAVGIRAVIKPGVNKKTGEPFRRKDMSIGFSMFAVIFLVLIGITAPKQNPVTLQEAKTSSNQPASVDQDSATANPQSTAPTITTTQETDPQPIPYTTQNQNSSSLAKGQTKVIQQGQNGSENLTYTVTYTNGVQSDKSLTATTVVTPPVAQIVAVGTYVAPAPRSYAPAPQASCSPLTNGGNCYEPGEYCRASDHGATGVAGNGESIQCLDNNGWRWEPR